MIKIAVIGAGILGTRHARVFQEQPEFELVAIADVDLTRAQKLAQCYGIPAYADYCAMLQSEKLDALAVATPDFLHRDPVITGIKAGKHIFMEKPLATSAEDAREIAAAASESNRTIMVNFSQRFHNDYCWIKKMIKWGEIGNPVMVTSIKFDTILVPTEMIGWAHQTSPFYFMSSHDLDLVHWYLGSNPLEVVAHEARGVLETFGVEVHDGINALIRFESGISANFHSSWIHPKTYPVVADGLLQIIGSKGTITYTNRNRKLEMYNQQSGNEIFMSGPGTADEVNGKIVGAFTDSVRYFLQCILEGQKPMSSPERILPTALAQAAVVESLQTGKSVRISNNHVYKQ